jgi:hypothetical protein
VTTTRLRQVALVAGQLETGEASLRRALRLGEPFHDPGVGEFGLDNAVFALGDTFLEIVAPVRADTTAGRYLARRRGGGGYMAIFQVADLEEARSRADALGVRVVWRIDGPDMAGTHLHPKDVPGAIVSLDWARPAGSWRWAGPAWAGKVPEHGPGGILGLTVEVGEPAQAARRWAEVLGAGGDVGAGEQEACVALDEGRQTLRFVPTGAGDAGRPPGITEVTVAVDGWDAGSPGAVEVCGVRFVVRPVGGRSGA